MATDMTAEQAEKYVRAHWDSCDVEDHRLCCGGLAWRAVIEPHWSAWRDTASKAWLAVAEYTRAHEQKIAEKRAEIEYMTEVFGHARSCDCAGCRARDRIIAMLKAQLAELLRGWREK